MPGCFETASLGWRYGSMVEQLLGMYEVCGYMPSTGGTKKAKNLSVPLCYNDVISCFSLLAF